MSQLTKQIKRLRLRDGDLIVVRNEIDMESILSAAQMLIKDGVQLPNCPIVIAQESIHRLDKKYLRKLLDDKAA